MLLLLFSLCVVVSLLNYGYHVLAQFQYRTPIKSNNALILIAHPDDECMFFGPTISALRSFSRTRIHVLCLSTGNADGLGNRRKKELVKSCQVFGIQPALVKSLDHAELQDGMKNKWSPAIISNILTDYVAKHKIDTIITFDDYGVSGHPNHIAACQGAKHFKDHNPIQLYKLESIPLARKYNDDEFKRKYKELKRRVREIEESEVPPPTKAGRSSGKLAGAAVPRKKKDPNAPKGPGNVFFLYCRMERDKIKDEMPNEGLGEVTRALGQKWKALAKDEKQASPSQLLFIYYDMYKKEQGEYEVAMKSYTAGSTNPATENKEEKIDKKENEEDELEDEEQENEEIDMLQEDEGEGISEAVESPAPNANDTVGQSNQ
ncbi:hypothetical protein DFQ30_009904 [Apophysomyces sp. BC1015]|nr:hypothetical protein DFQ30_009904 [Apophysomyces sp. BC1015]